jgi:hypothetical protein
VADNREKIAEIEEVLASGVESVTVDGVTTRINHTLLRKELQRLRDADELLKHTRPRAASINLEGLFEA